MARALVVAWTGVFVSGVALAEGPPPFAFEWVVGYTPGQVATDLEGNLWIINSDSYMVQRATRDGHSLYPVPYPSRDVYRNEAGNMFLMGTNSYVLMADSVSLVQAYFPETGTGIVANAENQVSVVISGRPDMIERFTSLGYLIGTRSLSFEPLDLALAPGGILLIGDPAGRRIVRFDRYARYVDAWAGYDVRGLAVDTDGNILVCSSASISKLSSDGALLTSWGEAGDAPGQFRDAVGIAVNDQGDVYVADRATRRILMFGTRLPEDDPPPPPPPPPAPCPFPSLGNHAAAMLLHVGSAANHCPCRPVAGLPDVVTAAETSPDGFTHHEVYLIGSPPSTGLLGMDAAVAYPGGLEIVSWHSCADVEFPEPQWPDSGSGIAFAWHNCRLTDIAVAGYFEIVARAPATLRVLPYPGQTRARMAPCPSRDLALQVSPDRLGWVSWGGAAVGPDTDGCNPGLGPCQDLTPALPTTWGRLKALYSH